MIAAQKDGQTLGHGLVCGAPEAVCPAHGFVVFVDASGGVVLRVFGRGQIAPIAQAVAEVCERLGEPCGAVGIRPHEAALTAFSGVHRRADEDDIVHV